MLLGQLKLVAFVKSCIVAAGLYHGSMQNLMLKFSVVVSENAHLKTVLVLFLNIGWRHADEAVAQVIVFVNLVFNDIYLAHGAAILQICPYFSQDNAVKLLYYNRLLLALIN